MKIISIYKVSKIFIEKIAGACLIRHKKRPETVSYQVYLHTCYPLEAVLKAYKYLRSYKIIELRGRRFNKKNLKILKKSTA